MKKRFIRSNLRTLIIATLPVLILTSLIFFSSCKSRSVRDIRVARGWEPVYQERSVKVKETRTKDDALIQNLFMVSARPNIELPHQEGMEAKPGGAIISEKVTYTNAEKIARSTPEGNKATNLNEVQHLSEVVVTAKARFTPEQNGKVNVDFIVKVPRQLLSTDWRVTLSPKLLHNDSIVKLKDVVVKGQNFAQKQKQAYADYDNYLKSIVKKEDYDIAFVDHEGVKQDIENKQKFYYNEYLKEWRRQTDYEKWKSEKEKKESEENTRREALELQQFHDNVRKAREEAMKEVSKGKDTTGFYVRYMQKRMPKTKNTKNQQQSQADFDKELKEVPSRFRDLFLAERGMGEIKNQRLTVQDSLEIVKHRYKVEEIAANELKEARKEEVREEMIYFPYEENTKLDTVIYADRDFIYYYSQEYPVTPGLRNLRIVMNSKTDAVDRSTFHQPTSDTLSYYVSSLSQLVDPSLVVKTTTLYRDVFNSLTMYPVFLPERWTFNVNYKNNREEADKIIDTYKTFTKDGKFIMDSVILRVSTDLDGNFDNNAALTMKRANTLQEFFSKELGVHDVFKTRYIGEDWNTMAKLIARRNDLSHKEEILDMLRNAVNPDITEREMKKEYPYDFRIIRDSIYPKLRKVDVYFNMTRTGMTEEVTVSKEVRPRYEEALQLLHDRKYWEAMEILSDYPDYNAALCLVCMGYNAKALEILEKLEPNGNTEYLMAILSIRANDDKSAKDHLIKSCGLDPSKVYRATLDPEIANLVKKYNLENEMIRAASVNNTQVEE